MSDLYADIGAGLGFGGGRIPMRLWRAGLISPRHDRDMAGNTLISLAFCNKDGIVFRLREARWLASTSRMLPSLSDSEVGLIDNILISLSFVFLVGNFNSNEINGLI